MQITLFLAKQLLPKLINIPVPVCGNGICSAVEKMEYAVYQQYRR